MAAIQHTMATQRNGETVTIDEITLGIAKRSKSIKARILYLDYT